MSPETTEPTTAARPRHEPSADAWAALLAGTVPEDTATAEDAALVDRYGPIVALGREYVLAQLAQSADGFIASRTGDSQFVSGPEDRVHLHRLRALVDAVVVGAATVTADDCRLTTRDVPGEDATRVIVDLRGRVPRDAHLLTDGSAPTVWIVGPDAEVPASLAPHVHVERVDAEGDVAPARILERLRALGLKRVLVEGGGRTVSRFLAAGLIDRLFLTTAPLLIGDGVPALRFPGRDALSEAITAPVRRFAFGDDLCTEFDLAAARDARSASTPATVGEVSA